MNGISTNTTIDACIVAAHQAIDIECEKDGDVDELLVAVTKSLTALKITDEPEIKVGDVVKLNSGGKAMTVNKVKGSDAEVIWFDGENAFRSDRFNVAMLRVLPPRPTEPQEDPKGKEAREYLIAAMVAFENDPADSPFLKGYEAALYAIYGDLFMTAEERRAARELDAGTLAGTAPKCPNVPVSQDDHQHLQDFSFKSGTFGAVGTGTFDVGTPITASRIIIWTMVTLGALALVAWSAGIIR